jgi:hypothetical protein
MEGSGGAGGGYLPLAGSQSLLRHQQAGLTAQGFLDLVEENLELVHDFFSRDRSYILTGMKIGSNPRISNFSPSRQSGTEDKGMEDKLLCMLHSRETTLQYYADYRDLDMTRDPRRWDKMQNPGNRLQGMLPEFAKAQGFPRTVTHPLRKAVSIAQKQLIVETEISAPGIAFVILPIFRQLNLVYAPQLKLLCNLLLSERYIHVLRLAWSYSDKVTRYQQNYKYCIGKSCLPIYLRPLSHDRSPLAVLYIDPANEESEGVTQVVRNYWLGERQS